MEGPLQLWPKTEFRWKSRSIRDAQKLHSAEWLHQMIRFKHRGGARLQLLQFGHLLGMHFDSCQPIRPGVSIVARIEWVTEL